MNPIDLLGGKTWNELYNEYGSLRKMSKAINVPKSTISRKLEIERTTGETLPPNEHSLNHVPLRQVEMNEEGETHLRTPPSSVIRTKAEAIEYHKVDLEKYEVYNHKVNSWNSLVDGKKVLLHQVVLSIRPIKEDKHASILKVISELTDRNLGLKRKPKKYHNKGGVLIEVNLPDVHLGKVCESEDSHDVYNMEIAERRFCEFIDKTLIKAQDYKVDQFLLPVGSDFFNVDGRNSTTTKGTPQLSANRFPTLFRKGLDMYEYAIGELSKIANVHVCCVPGNHDFEHTWTLAMTLEGYHNKDKRVTFDNSAFSRKYYRYKDVLIGMSHGNEEKFKELPMIMLTERKDAGECKFKTWHIGHLHKKKQYGTIGLDENYGVEVRILASLSGTDEWHAKKGYINPNMKNAELFVYNDHGIEDIRYIYVN